MEHVVVTLRYKQNETDLELPVSVPLFVLAPILMERLVWREGKPVDGTHFVGRVQGSGVVIRPFETLAQAGVADGEVLELRTMEGNISSGDLNTPQTNLAGKVYLQSTDTGEVFVCRGKTTLIGRTPECTINLSQMPHNDVVSRRHANIIRRESGYWISDERSTNGTIVDGLTLDEGDNVKIRNGSQLQFGKDGPTFIFYDGTE